MGERRGLDPGPGGPALSGFPGTLASAGPTRAGTAVARMSPSPVRPIPTGSLSSSKASQDRKLTSTPREIAKSPHSAVPEHHPHPISPYEHLLRGVSGVDLYRGHIPLAFDPTSIPRGIPLDAGDCPPTQGTPQQLEMVHGGRTSSVSAQGLLGRQLGSARWGN